jgi:hypothetical protein
LTLYGVLDPPLGDGGGFFFFFLAKKSLVFVLEELFSPTLMDLPENACELSE